LVEGRRFTVGVVGMIGALLALPARARAAPARTGARLTWARGVEADTCVGRVGLEEDVKARLGYDPFALPSELAIEGTVVRASPAGFRAELVVRDAAGKALGSRQLVSREADCRPLGEAVAVAITVAIDPDAPGTRAALAEETPFVAVPDAPPPPVAPPAAAREGERVHALVTIGASAGVLPGLAPSTSLRVRAKAAPWLEVGLGAHVWPESRSAGAGFGLASASVDACALPFARARALLFCAGLHAGVLDVFVHAADLSPVEVGPFAWAGAEAGPALSLPIAGALRLEVDAAALVPIVRRQAFVRGQAEPLWEQRAVGGRAEVGVGATF
jgi:hypothetical protein